MRSCFELLVSATLFFLPILADELEFTKHHTSGAAIVKHGSQTFVAAYQADDFDPQHTPELAIHTLCRWTLVPSTPAALESSDARQVVFLEGTKSGHSILAFGDWRFEFIPVDAAARLNVIQQYQRIKYREKLRVIIKQINETVLITVTDKY